MFKTFKDTNADLMRKLASEIPAPVERFVTKAAPIDASGFFTQPEVNIQNLSTEELISGLAGAEDAADARFRRQMMDLYPSIPSMWSVPRPTPEREFQGHMFWPVPSSKATSGGTLSKSQVDRTVAEMFLRAAKKGLNLHALGDDVKELLHEMVKQGKIRLVEGPQSLSISTI